MVERARWLVIGPRTSAWDAGLAAKRRDDCVVDVVLADPPGPNREQEVHFLSGFAVEHRRLCRSQSLPGLDGSAQKRVDGFGEGGAGFVGGDVEQADRSVS